MIVGKFKHTYTFLTIGKRFDDLQYDPANEQLPSLMSQQMFPQPFMSELPETQLDGYQYNTEYAKSGIPSEPMIEDNLSSANDIESSQQDIPLGSLASTDSERLYGNVRLKDLLSFSKFISFISELCDASYNILHCFKRSTILELKHENQTLIPVPDMSLVKLTAG